MATSKKGRGGVVTKVLAITGGVIVAKLANNISFLSANPVMGGAIKAGAGIFLASQKNQFISDMGLGMAAAGAGEVASSFISPSSTTSTVSGLLNLPSTPRNASTLTGAIMGTPYMKMD